MEGWLAFAVAVVSVIVGTKGIFRGKTAEGLVKSVSNREMQQNRQPHSAGQPYKKIIIPQ
ncbi:MAG: hypothetical protein A3E57_06895 [Candidatus Muproteobacteria bacterium RIFCSPHIGHO2_12_FULL_60_33]|uniref:Uncharacterized protein n=1 Tax=Candidatus Muproteobacteria bacterium RIFCSPLOWO2_01_FULL_60_18 TaxID=1817768 RepID=A0A1F6U5T4_9PROT|nr:MAG: hypothetical protein A3A87_04090 [Candidatus Muproteobacteria bacterium RIFCSPLOWO2_01_FULL_60_18]OGI53272.1 MAG: hypothetical protein A2W42_01495 [Candidatus Muproteobacteria bacterium RIFCSPHIGHO2_01_60_12]OGI53883.1 MAG: hypothetical protein A3D32_05390 [Candidatus Muproteobacteria bacterium RIFCSPHIGHO2_02_FULL_60_13]OGI56326.1 MAG: hypothetical protein A3E57_06895 [Candidatus Muproteobacteria bacterium RIFCSPHIGHO2_12_FULL_60_33]OGI59268.1 MAG: hypothetical protein A2809_01905 [Can